MIKRSDAIQLIIIAVVATYILHGEINRCLGWGNDIIMPYAPVFLFLCVAIFGGYMMWLFYEKWLRKNAYDLYMWAGLWFNLVNGCYMALSGWWWIGAVFSWFLAFIFFFFLTDRKRDEAITRQEEIEKEQEEIEKELAERLGQNNME